MASQPSEHALALGLANDAREKARLGQLDSLPYYRDRSLEMFRKHDNLTQWLQLHQDLGRHFRDVKRDAVMAEQYFLAGIQRAWRKPRSSAEWEVWGLVHLSMGYTCSSLKADLNGARDFYELGRSIWQDTLHRADTVLADMVLRPLGNLYSRLRDRENTLRYLGQALQICQQHGAWDKAAIAANGLGMFHFNVEEYPEAIRWFRQVDSLPSLSPHPKITLWLNMGMALLKNGDQQGAEHATNLAIGMLERYPEKGAKHQRESHWSYAHNNLGNIHQNLGHFELAKDHFLQFIQMQVGLKGTPHSREAAQGYVDLCDLFMEWGKPDSTLRYAQLALHSLLKDSSLLQDYYASPSAELIYPEQTLYLALEQKIKAISAISVQKPKDLALPAAFLESCDLLFLTDELMRREYAFEKSRLWRQAVSQPYLGQAIGMAHRLWSRSGGDKRLMEAAWQYAELARERIWIEQWYAQEKAARMPSDIRSELDSLREQQNRLQAQVFEMKIRGKAATPEADALETALFKAVKARQSILKSQERENNGRISLPKTDLSALCRVLDPDQAILQYVTVDRHIFVFVLTKDGIQHFLQYLKPPNLAAAVEDLRESLTNEVEADLALFSQSAALLYDVLLDGPLRLLPKTVTRLVIIQDAPLHDVPFDLLGKANVKVDFKTYPYLFQRYAVSYASSGNVLLKQSGQAPASSAERLFVGFAPQYAESDTLRGSASIARTIQCRMGRYKDLPEARAEVLEIAKLTQGEAFVGKEASELRFKQEGARYRILHLAMHAQLNTESPMASKLLFTHDSADVRQDNDLYAIELYGLQLNADLAVLSACQTGLGKVQAGEGVMSLGRAFAFAGARASLLSLWEVEDGATRALMVLFYDNLIKGQRKDEALQLARKSYLENCKERKLRSPYYWGGFVMSGNPAPIFGK